MGAAGTPSRGGEDSPDVAFVQEYYEIVKTQLMSEKGSINFLTADGNQAPQ